MSIYNFAPMPTTTSEVDFSTWEGGFSDDDIKKITSYAEDNLTFDKATVSGFDKTAEYEDVRKSKTAWIGHNQDTAWIYDRLAYIARASNANHWRFDLSGFVEDFQFTKYDEKDAHYTWHVDAYKGVNGFTPRKLSMVLQLSDPSEYEGGDFEIMTSSKSQALPKAKGLVILFPSYVLHRVTPVTSGIRKSIVVWVSGPPFK